MLLIISLWPFLTKLLLMIPGIPSAVKYLADVFLVLFVLAIFTGRKLQIRRTIFPPVAMIGIFFLYTLAVYVFRFQSPFYYLWGFRNNFRFYIAFILYAEMLTEEEGLSWFRILDVLFWINLVLSIIQFVFMGYSGDFLGGIFGVEGASNGFTLIFISIVVAKSLLCYQEQQEPLWLCLLKAAAALLVAAMAEMKFFFVLFAIILALSSLLTRFSWGKVTVIVAAVATIGIFASLLESIFGIENLLSFEYLWGVATQDNYSSGDDINRLSAIATLSETIVTKPVDQIFGLGLGNCDTSAFQVCNTPFYRRYGYLHYIWFSAAMMFLETGYLGLLCYFGFFIVCFWCSRKKVKDESGNPLFSKLAMILSLVCCIIAFYNSALRVESAYMVYFTLALPFIRQSSSASVSTHAAALFPSEGGIVL
ncbi:MAG: hypothetical protein J6K55_10155 [Clostridia bacterium]|nr:hypothetical protein [Clostridia bacterium]